MDIRILFAYGMAIILCGSAFPGIRVALESYSPEHVALLRMGTASFVLFFIALKMKMKPPALKDIPAILLLGGLGFSVYHTFLSIGEKNCRSRHSQFTDCVGAPSFSFARCRLSKREIWRCRLDWIIDRFHRRWGYFAIRRNFPD